ncbi:MAG: hypothetical protein IJV40_09620 [Oscillospiraceae bacterium]|nr:hypothetical protein [Oscillospiraceae bacterium]
MTKQKQDLVVMDMEIYESLVDTAIIDHAIRTAELEIAAGAELLDAQDALTVLRRKQRGYRLRKETVLFSN